MKILFFTDPHNSDVPPRMRTSSYTEDILAKQEALIKPAKSCDMVICGGDVFHSKKMERISHKLVNKIMEIYREYPKTYILTGNHDIDTQMDWSDRPLGTLDKLPNISVQHATVVHEENVDFIFYGGGEFHGIEAFQEWFGSCGMLPREKGRFRVGVFHLSIAEQEYKFPVLHPGLLEPDLDLLLLGHLHDYQTCSGKRVAPGGLSRGVLNIDTSLERKVYYAMVGVGKEKIETMLYEIPIKPVDEVFRMDKKANEVKEDADVKTFMEYINKLVLPKALSKEELFDFINKMDNIKETVKKKAIKILEEL